MIHLAAYFSRRALQAHPKLASTHIEVFIMNFNPNEPQATYLEYFYPQWRFSYLRMTQCILRRDTCIFHSNFEPSKTCAIIKKYRVNTFVNHVFNMHQLCAHKLEPEDDLSSVEILVPAGSTVSRQLINLTQRMFPNAFIQRKLGMSEVGVITKRTKACKNPDSEGFVYPGVQIRIVETSTGRTLGSNEVGEVYVKSDCMMSEYYKNPVRTNEFIDEEGWAHTGDLACIDENGELVVKGRIKECIRVKMKDILPKDLEDILLTHPAVEDVVVVPVHHEMDYERPFIFVKLLPGTKLSEEDVINLSAPVYRLDKGYISFTQEDFPRTVNGKIDRSKLKDTANSIVNV